MTTWREQLAFAPLDTAERGEEIGRRLRHAIELGVLEHGSQLPSESDLAARMGVSTLTLRNALAELRQMGLIETRRGKNGGSFVSSNTGDFARARLDSLAEYSIDDLRDIREYRAFLSGAAAAAASERSNRISTGRLASMGSTIESYERPTDLTRADSRFHIEMAAMSGSVRLTRQEMAMQAEVGALVWAAAPDRASAAAVEHAAIVEAIRAGDTELARALAEQHIRSDMNRIIDKRMSLTSGLAEPPPGTTIGDAAISAVEAFATMLYETAATSIRSIENAVLQEAGPHPAAGVRPEDLSRVYDVARGSLALTSPLLYGMGFNAGPPFLLAPAEIWSYTPSGLESPQRLEMDAEFYDIETAPWLPPNEYDSVWTSHAYVDANATNEHIITFSKRVMKHGTLLGFAAADVLLRQLQARLEPFLRAMPPNTCIVDQNDVVIATNTGSLIGGTWNASSHQGRRITFRAVPWQLCVGA